MSSPFSCLRCLKDYKTKPRLLRHLKGKRICKVVDNGSNIDREDLIINLEGCGYKCNLCNASFNGEISYQRHIETCLGNSCFFKNPLVINKYPDKKNINDLAYKLVLVIRDSYLVPKSYLKVRSNGTYLIYKDGRWSIPYGKYVFINTILNRLAESPKCPEALRDEIHRYSNNIITYDDINKIKRPHFYNNFIQLLLKTIDRPDSLLTPAEKIKDITRISKLRFETKEYMKKKKLKRIQKERMQASRSNRLKKERVNVDIIKDNGIKFFNEIDINEKRDSNLENILFELVRVDLSFKDEIIEYFVNNSNRIDAEIIGNHIYEHEIYYRDDYLKMTPNCQH